MERLEGWKTALAVRATSQTALDDGAIGFPGLDAGALAASIESDLALASARPSTPRPPAEPARSGGDAATTLRVEAGGTSDLATGRLRAPRPSGELATALAVIARAAATANLVRGEAVAYLALGELQWSGTAAPLALVPVELTLGDRAGGSTAGAQDAWELAIAAGPARVNPVLAARLAREYGLVLPEAGYAAISDAAAAFAATRPGWAIARTVALGTLATAAAEIAADAEAVTVAAHPLLERLATGDGPAMTLPPAGAAPDVLAPLEADGAQLAAIGAAVAGASFVLDGPPGTGKSQTIANLVVACAAAGKSLLVVAETPAAREVVLARLAAVGLGEACLHLDASREAIVGQLGRVLDRAFRPGSGPHVPSSAIEDARLAELRAALDAHAAAMHQTGPFGRSLHEVIGRLVELRTTPNAALADGDATGLDRATFDRRLAAVTALGAAAAAVEPVAGHPWRASGLDRWPLAADDRDARRRRTLAALAEARDAGDELADAAAEVVALVPGLAMARPDQLVALGALAAVAASSPRPGAELLTQLRNPRADEIDERIALLRARGGGANLIDQPRDPSAFLALAARHRQLATEVDDRFSDAVEDLDVGALWAQLKKWTGSVAPLRFVALRGVRAEIQAAALQGELHSDEAMIDALAAAIAERACRAALALAAEPARRWFGELGGDPLALDLAKIDAAVSWAAELRRAFDAAEVGEAQRPSAWRALVAQVGANGAASSRATTATGDDGAAEDPAGAATDELGVFRRAADAVGRWQAALQALADATGLPPALLGAGETSHLDALAEQIAHLAAAIDALPAWTVYTAARDTARAMGVGPAALAIELGDLGADELAPAWERATLLAWGDAELGDSDVLGTFHGAAHHATVAAFADMERAALAVARTRAITRLAERVPARRGADPTGEIALLVDEVKAVRNPRTPTAAAKSGPIPTYTRRSLSGAIATTAIDEAVAPTSVVTRTRATTGAPIRITGNTPIPPFVPRTVRELLGALPTVLARLAPCIVASPAAIARHLDPALPRFDVVVIDEASLVPAAHALGAIARAGALVVSGDARQCAPADGSESILAAAVAARIPAIGLVTHYRSRHEDLFAVANRTAYADRLTAFPVAQGSADLGVLWRRVDAISDRATGENRGEADAVVAELALRLRDPSQRVRSYAVATFSTGQRDRVAQLFAAACAAEPALAEACARARAAGEPVLIEHARDLQGQERDVVLVTVGHGWDADGQLDANLGDVSEAAALVAFTRARDQLIVVSGFAPEDVPATASRGVRLVAEQIAFARAGGGAARGGDLAASPITAAIARALADRGWTVRHQVGCGAVRIDLAVVDPSEPNDNERLVLAIEHDGRAYAGVPAARDRDRLRAQQLAASGWRTHRIWTLDWWSDADREISRAHNAIVAAIAATRTRRAPMPLAARARSMSGRHAAQQAPAAPAPTPAVLRIPPKPTTVDATQPTAVPVFAASADDITVGNGAGIVAGAIAGGLSVPLVADGSGGLAAAVTSALADQASAPVKVKRGAIAIGPYSAAAIPAGRRAPDDMFAPRHAAELGKVIEQVLAAEAPMHVNLLARRVGAYFGIGRLSQRVIDQVKAAAAGRATWGAEDGIVWRHDQDPTSVPAVRVAGGGAEAKRAIDEVPLAELASAARIVVERAGGIGATDLVRDTARLLGFARITADVTARVGVGVSLATQRQLIAVTDGRASIPAN